MGKKKRLLLLGMAAMLLFGLSGCGKSKMTGSESYSSDEVKELQISTDTWKVQIAASQDENVSVALDGGNAAKGTEPAVALQNGILTVVQKSKEEELQDQLALGKRGEILLSLPSDCIIPIQINNELGDIDVDGIPATDFKLVNHAGYATFSHFTADSLQASSVSGDITLKNSDVESVEVVTASGYVQQGGTNFTAAEIITKSGEVNMSEISPDTDIQIQTGSGDVTVSYRTTPDNLEFDVTSGSEDITVGFHDAAYHKETASCRQGMIGDGQNKLKVSCDNAAVIIQ